MRLLFVTFAVFLLILIFGRGLYWVVSGDLHGDGAMSHRHVSQDESMQSHKLFRIDGQRSSARAVAINQSDSMRPNYELQRDKRDEQSKGHAPNNAPVKNEKAPIKFKKVRVMGRTASPRLDFTQETLPVERVDEPIRQEFFQKVFEPVGDYSF